MDNFEKYIIEQRNRIQDDTPHEGHLERFEMKLEKQQKRKPIRLIVSITSIAAILALAFLLINPNRKNVETFTLSDVSDQYAEVEFYYTNTINKQTNQLKEYAKGSNSENIQLLLDEMEEYDAVYTQLCKDLEATPNDQRVIHAMIDYYQTKLEIINRILIELESKKEDINHENITI